MYATHEFQFRLHKVLLEAFSVQMLGGRTPGIDLAFADDEREVLGLFQERTGIAFRGVARSRDYTLFAKLTREGRYMAEWIMTDPLPVAMAIPAEYGA